MLKKIGIFIVFSVQVLCALFFVSDILFTTLGVRTHPISWQNRELLEIGASVGLILGVILGLIVLRQTLLHKKLAENKLRAASSAFMEMIEEHFHTWKLTPAERDVALFAIKGFSTLEIAKLRNSSEGTIKAQTNAIYRKANVSGRPQLLSLFIDDLMGDGLN